MKRPPCWYPVGVELFCHVDTVLFLWICVATGHVSKYALSLSFLFLFHRETRHLVGMRRYQFAVYNWRSSSSLTLTLGPRRNSGQKKPCCYVYCLVVYVQTITVSFIFTLIVYNIFRIHTEEWCSCIGTIVKHNSEACVWFLNFLAGERGKGYVR